MTPQFHACARLPGSYTRKARQEKIDYLVQRLELQRCLDTSKLTLRPTDTGDPFTFLLTPQTGPITRVGCVGINRHNYSNYLLSLETLCHNSWVPTGEKLTIISRTSNHKGKLAKVWTSTVSLYVGLLTLGAVR